MVQETSGSEGHNVAGLRRREAMMQAAYSLFMEKGYAAVSVDDIIHVAGGSKSSLYKFFGNKEGILKAVVEALADDMLQQIDVHFPSARTPRESLLRIGRVLIDLALSENALNQYRHALSSAREYPDVGRIWFECGPQRVFEGIEEFLERETAAGRLRTPDPTRATWFFAGMILFRHYLALPACAPPAGSAETQDALQQAVDVFLAAYGQ